jgi:hypothetical protein
VNNELPLRHHVQRCLQRDLGITLHDPDDNGDYWVMVDDQPVWVRCLLEHTPALARVWAPAASGVKRSAAVLRELNELNAGLRRLCCILGGGSVQVTSDLEIESIEPGELGRLVEHVGRTARHVGELMATVHGGEAVRLLVPSDVDSNG